MRKKQSPEDTPHYVDKKAFYKAMKQHVRLVNKNKKLKLPPPPPSDFICVCIMNIAHKLANRYNFVKYPFKEEMIGDAIENCLDCINRNKFNPRKSNNPFCYFTTTVFNAFVRRIQKEQKYLAVKYTLIKNSLLHEAGEIENIEQVTKYGNDYSDALMEEFIQKFEDSIKKKKAKTRLKKKTRNTIEGLIED